MMRSLYSGVSGLKTHQTKMDVIGNNISNVNTVAFKASSVTFSSIMYQTLSSASGANTEAGTGGVNAKQIGLGVTTGSTAVNITGPGASETTGLPFDLKITDKSTSSFFIVNNGAENVFTKAGSFYVDGAGNLCMKSTGYTVMGWGLDPATGTIRKDTVGPLKIMSAENQTSEPEATTQARCTGIVDNKNTQVTSPTGTVMNLTIYDNLGYPYTARFSIQAQDVKGGKYAVNLTDIIDEKGNSILTSNVSLNALFGPTAGDGQGTCTDVTENYKFAAGKSKTNIQIAVQNTAAINAGANGTPKYTYYFDAADINAQLGLTGELALPDGYRLSYTSEKMVYSDVMDELKNGGTVNVLDATGKVVGQGSATTNIPAVNGYSDKGVKWTFQSGTVDASGNFQADTNNKFTFGDNGLTKILTLDDYTSNGTVVTADDGTTGYKFKVGEIRSLLDLDQTEFPDDDAEIYYWPTLMNGQTVQLTTASGTPLSFTSNSDTAKVFSEDNPPVVKSIPRKYAGPEEILKDYSYTTITGGDLASATKETGQIFTEELPSDMELRYNLFTGSYTINTPLKDGFTLQFDTVEGTLKSIGGGDNMTQTLNLSALTAAGFNAFQDVKIDFSTLLNCNNGGTNTASMKGGDAGEAGKGKKLGSLTGLSVDQSGKIFASYSNGNTELLGQIAVAQFANASGLEATGDNCYRATLNSGEFDGIGVEIDADGSSITSGELEMSNVDLSGEFTSMITTQRGFQANSRIITVSDTLLEELINLKR